MVFKPISISKNLCSLSLAHILYFTVFFGATFYSLYFICFIFIFLPENFSLTFKLVKTLMQIISTHVKRREMARL